MSRDGEKKLMVRVEARIRAIRYSRSIERSCRHWILNFIYANGIKRPMFLGVPAFARGSRPASPAGGTKGDGGGAVPLVSPCKFENSSQGQFSERVTPCIGTGYRRVASIMLQFRA